MAVIREKRQFQIGTIGVARASEGGRIVGQAISRAADQFADMFYQEGLQVAEKAGTEAGQSVERERIMTINPQTGQPEAYTPPAPFGRVAAEAYQRVVQRRFQQSMDDEMRVRSAELAARYEDNPNATALYETAMSDYIAAMAENAEGEFRGYITDVGTSYLNLTRSNLAINQIRRERAAARESQAAAAAAANAQLESMVAQYGPDILNGPTIAASIAQSSNETVSDGVDAGLFAPTAIRTNNRDQRLAIARGTIRNAANSIQDPETLELLQHAIGTQNPSLVPAGFEGVAAAMRALGSDYSALAELEQFSDGLLSDQREYVGVLRAREVAELNRQEALSVFNLNEGTAGAVASAASLSLSPVQSGSIAETALSFYQNATAEASAYAQSGRTDLSTATINNRNAVLQGYVQGLHLRAVDGLTTEQTEQLEAAIMARNPNLAPTAQSREALSALLSIDQRTDYNVVEDFPPFIGSYRDGAADFVDAQNANAAFAQFVEGTQPAINDIRFQRGNDIAASIQSVASAVANIEGLAQNVRDDAITEIQFRGSQAYLSQFFENNPTETQIASAGAFLEGSAITEGLTQSQVNLLAQARELGAASGREANLRTHFNELNQTVRSLRVQEERRIEERQNLVRVFSGAGDPRSRDDRILVEERFQGSFAPQLAAAGYETLGQMFADPMALQNPEVRPILEAVNSMNVMPESLHNLFVSLSNGSFVGGSPAALLSHYTNYRNYNYGGVAMDNPMMLALSEEQRATLDFLADASPIIGSDNQALADLYVARSRVRNDTHFKDKAEIFFGSSPYEFVRNLDGASNLSASALRGMEAAAVSLYALSAERGMDVSSVRQRLERQIERTYPDGGGIVFAPDMSSRTRAPLSYAAPGNEDVMQSYILRRLSDNGISNATLGIRPESALALTARAIGGPILSAVGVEARPATGGGAYFLQPLGVPTEGFVQYQVMEQLPIEEGTRRSVMETVTDVIDGDTVTVRRPMIVSNRDPLFLLMLQNKASERNRLAISEAEAVGRVREQFSPAPEFEFGINP